MMQDAWRDNWQPRNVFPSSRPATSSLRVSLAINPLENRWPIKTCVQGEALLINADCQGASLMYFSFKEIVSNAHCFGGDRGCSLSRKRRWSNRRMRGWCFQFYGRWYLFLLRSQKLRRQKTKRANDGPESKSAHTLVASRVLLGIKPYPSYITLNNRHELEVKYIFFSISVTHTSKSYTQILVSRLYGRQKYVTGWRDRCV